MKRVEVGALVGFWGHPYARMGYVFSRGSGPMGKLIIELIGDEGQCGNTVRAESEVTSLAMSFAGPEQVIR